MLEQVLNTWCSRLLRLSYALLSARLLVTVFGASALAGVDAHDIDVCGSVRHHMHDTLGFLEAAVC